MLIDLDGTLTDSTELIRRSFDHPLHVHLGRATDEREWLSDLGRPLVWQFTQDPREVDAMVATYRAWNLAHHDELAWLVEGTRSAAAGALEHTGSSECVASWSVGSAIAGWGDAGNGTQRNTRVCFASRTPHKPGPEDRPGLARGSRCSQQRAFGARVRAPELRELVVKPGIGMRRLGVA